MRRRGTALIVAVVLLVGLQAAVITVVTSQSREQDAALARVEGARALYAADSALAIALAELKRVQDIDGNGVVGGVTSGSLLSGSNLSVTLGTVTASTASLTLRATTGRASRAMTVSASLMGGLVPGLDARFFASATGLSALANISWTSTPTLTTTWAGTLSQGNNGGSAQGWPGGPADRFGAEYSGYITIPSAGSWTFATNSDDGSDLWIGGVRIVNNDGLHGMMRVAGTVVLAAGTFSFRARAFDNSGGYGLIVTWRGPGVPAEVTIPASAYSRGSAPGGAGAVGISVGP
jgi:hypothetical protein